MSKSNSAKSNTLSELLSSEMAKKKDDASKQEKAPSPPKLPTKIKLQSLEGQIFELDYNIAKISQTIKTLVEESERPKDDSPIKLNNISSEALVKIIEYIKYHYKDPPLPEDERERERRRQMEIRDFDLKFVKSLSRNLLFELIMASNFLYIRCLIDLTCKYCATLFKSKTVEDIRKEFSIKNDFTPAEEEALLKENSWAENLN